MPCERCGYSGAYSSHSCSRCNPSKPNWDIRGTADASASSVKGIMGAIEWMAGNKYLAFVWVYLAWVITVFVIADSIGYMPEGSPIPTWVSVMALIVPIGVEIVFRKAIMKYVPMILQGILGMVGLFILGCIVFFFIMLIYYGVTS